MWLQKHLTTIKRHRGPTLLSAPALFGTYHLLAALRDNESKLVWIELTTSDKDDPIAQGNRLAEAVKQALSYPLYETAQHYSYGLKVLGSQLELLGPFTFAVSNADYAPQFAVDLLSLHRCDSRVVLAGASPADIFSLPETTQIITGGDLKLTLEDAKAFTQGYLSDSDIPTLLRMSNGAYELFIEKINEYLSLPLPTRPSPEGPRLAADHEVEVEPDLLLKVLVKQQKWLEALELACSLLPERVPSVLDEAGHVYHEAGLHKRLWELLNELPDVIKKHQYVLFWRLSAGWWQGLGEEVREDVEEHLAHYDAPDLRALYAGTIATAETAEVEAKRAYEDKQTALTTFQYGRLHRDALQGVEILRESVKVAERTKRPSHITRNASELTKQLLIVGFYKESVYWGRWTLEKFDEFGMVNSQRKLMLINDWAVARILTGEIVGLKQLLEEAEVQFENVLPHIIRNLTETLGDYYLSQGNPSEALACYLKNLVSEEREDAGYNALSVVQAYCHLNEPTKALEYATRAYMLVKGERWAFRFSSELAYGIALSTIEPRVGLNQLEHVQQETLRHAIPANFQAQLTLYLAWVYLQLENKKQAVETIKANRRVLEELSETGLTLLSGPKYLFKEVWELIGIDEKPVQLELRFLGQQEVRYQGKQLRLSPQMQEMLTLLALNPSGLSLEQLLLLTSGDNGNLSSFRVMLTKLRQQYVPITNQPYKIDVTYTADFIQIQALIEKGHLRRALELYKGSLLGHSEAPGIVDEREALEESLREAVLVSEDPEALYTFANQLPDDLEVWEALEKVLPKNDTRVPVVGTRVRRIRESWGG
jgi:tetratricopeptide (TPR) repeat protein